MWHPNWSIEASQSVRQRSSFFFHLLFRYLLHVPLPHNPGWLLKTHGNVLISECAERKWGRAFHFKSAPGTLPFTSSYIPLNRM